MSHSTYAAIEEVEDVINDGVCPGDVVDVEGGTSGHNLTGIAGVPQGAYITLHGLVVWTREQHLRHNYETQHQEEKENVHLEYPSQHMEIGEHPTSCLACKQQTYLNQTIHRTNILN